MKAVRRDVQVGDRVLLRQAKQNKLSTNYETRSYIVMERRGTSAV